MLDIDIDLSWNYIFVLSLCNITWRNNDVRPFFTTKTEELINTSSTNSISRNLFARSEELINDRFRSNTDESLRQWWINENSLSTKVTVQFIFNLSKQVIETRKSKEQRTKIEHPRKFSRQKVLWNQRREYRSVLECYCYYLRKEKINLTFVSFINVKFRSVITIAYIVTWISCFFFLRQCENYQQCRWSYFLNLKLLELNITLKN